MELRFDAMLYSNLGNENSETGHSKCSRRSQDPHPWSTWMHSLQTIFSHFTNNHFRGENTCS